MAIKLIFSAILIMFWWLNIYASSPLKQLDQYRYLKKYKKM